MTIIAGIVLILSWLSAVICLTGVIVEGNIKDKVKNLVRASINIMTIYLMLYMLGVII
ncbi:MAG TPA: hypothetical protein K8V90_09825 [Romboutsia timonensis]|uniref:Uncharacterized protein n=1 Tax=Romboutsia timonensis TaxID=1776391 RepID=A0A921T0C1_9FIRM|nr:hypothetical protein [Romboutsia timonensis]